MSGNEEELYSAEGFQSLPVDETMFHWSDLESSADDEDNNDSEIDDNTDSEHEDEPPRNISRLPQEEDNHDAGYSMNKTQQTFDLE